MNSHICTQLKGLENIKELEEEQEEEDNLDESINTKIEKESNKYRFFMFEYRKIKGYFFEKLELSSLHFCYLETTLST
jgi:hypothetical protein